MPLTETVNNGGEISLGKNTKRSVLDILSLRCLFDNPVDKQVARYFNSNNNNNNNS